MSSDWNQSWLPHDNQTYTSTFVINTVWYQRTCHSFCLCLTLVWNNCVLKLPQSQINDVFETNSGRNKRNTADITTDGYILKYLEETNISLDGTRGMDGS